jgi:nucleoside-diphosphate-sugar epimerase
VKVLVTGSSGHLGEALVRTIREQGHEVVGLDVVDSATTTVIGSVADHGLIRGCIQGVDAVIHAATLHKPHIGTHSWADFVNTNVTGTSNLLREAVNAGVQGFVYTSTTSAFGRALTPPSDAPAVWVTEEVVPKARNIYGVTKTAAEDLCELMHREHELPCVVLRTSRFFPESDDRDGHREQFGDLNLKVNELLYRRIDLADVVDAHLCAVEQAKIIGFGRFIVSATTPFGPSDLVDLRSDAPSVVRRIFPDYEHVYERLSWSMLPSIDRVYVNTRAQEALAWHPRYDFERALGSLRAGEDPRSPLSLEIGKKGYHDRSVGVYTTC